ncbi:MAG TPA: hypothetical protein VLA36_04980 [Longimicrobiales bacterium]|nr:hypothetical protein [Longimicrobiales bacterium]
MTTAATSARSHFPAKAEDRLRYEFSDAPARAYRVVMSVGDREVEREVSILEDEWWMQRR